MRLCALWEFPLAIANAKIYIHEIMVHELNRIDWEYQVFARVCVSSSDFHKIEMFHING